MSSDIYQSTVEINTPLNQDIYITLPLSNNDGTEKIIVFGKSVQENLNHKKIILYSRFIDPSGLGPVYLNLEFIQGGQSVKLVSITSKSGEQYWQILYGNFDMNDIITYSDNICIFIFLL